MATELPETDLKQVRLSEDARTVLDALKSNGHISDLADGYKLGIALAIAFHREPSIESGPRKTYISVGDLDPDIHIKTAVAEMYPDWAAIPYRAAEDLAHQGVDILGGFLEGDTPWFGEIVEKARAANTGSDS